MRRCSLPLVLGLVVCSLAACGPTEQVKDDPQPRDPNGAVTILNPTPNKPLLGEVAIEVEVVLARDVQKMELFVGDVADPVVVSETLTDTLLWDAGESPVEALQQIFVKVTDKDGNGYDSAPVNVIVLGATGQAVSFTDGHAGAIRIPADYDGTQEIDVKHHWTTPATARRAIGIGHWETQAGQEEWTIEIALGHGTCPHAGQVWGERVISSETPVIIDLDLNPLVGLPQLPGDSFVHLRPVIGTAAPYSHLGEFVPYSVDVYLFE